MVEELDPRLLFGWKLAVGIRGHDKSEGVHVELLEAPLRYPDYSL